jgi:DNA-binding MarR family transcriptional regulator
MTSTDSTESPVDRAQFAADFGWGVLRAARALRNLGDEGGLNSTQNTALARIERHRSITVSELAAIESIARPTASAVVKRLEELGLLQRRDDPLDGRVCYLEITKSGRTHLRTIRMRRSRWLLNRIESYSDEQIATLGLALDLLDKMGEGLELLPPDIEKARAAGSRGASKGRK